MKLSVKKFSKKSLSLLIALIMVISAMPFSPLSSPIEANAAETKTTISVWDASRATANTASGARYSYKDSQTKKTISGIQWGSLTHNSTYLTVSNTALSFAEISNSGAITGNDNIINLGISGNKWSFSAKFAYCGSSTKTTVFGLASTTKRQYTQSNTGANANNAGGTVISNGYVADLVDIRADGTVYIGNKWNENEVVSGISSSDLASSSATDTKILTVTYDNGNLTIDINGTQKISKTVDTALFSAGVGNYLAGPNVQVYSGGDTPYYQVTSGGAYLYNMNLYSLSGATYEQEGSEPKPPTNRTASVVGYGAVKKSGNNRASGTTITIVNDRQDDNFGIGFVNFDISSLSNTGFNVGSAIYNMTYSISSSGREAMGLSFYYATKNDTVFNYTNTSQAANLTDTGISDNVYGTTNQHIDKAKTYLGLQKIADVSTHTGATNASFSVDISPAIRYALSKGKTNCQLLIMLTTAGGEGKYNSSGQSGYWSDTAVTVNTSSVPVTMQTDADYVRDHISSANKTYTNIYVNNADSNFMSGVISGSPFVDTTAVTINDYDSDHGNSISLKIFGMTDAVAIYTGTSSDIRFPVIFQNSGYGNASNVRTYMSVDHISLSSGNFAMSGNNWDRCSSWNDLTNNSESTFNFYSTRGGNFEREDANSTNKFLTSEQKTWRNYIKYTGSVNTTDYYEKLTSATFNFQADFTLNWRKNSWASWNNWGQGAKGPNYNKDLTYPLGLYVLNYKPLNDIVIPQAFIDNCNEISQNSWKYTQAGLDNYYSVVADIIDFNLAHESMTSETEVAAVANKIKGLVTRYDKYKSPERKKLTLTFNRNDGTNATMEITAGESVGTLPANSSATHIDGTNTHNGFVWEGVTTASVPQSDNTYFETSAVVNCSGGTATCTQKAICSSCNAEYGSLAKHSFETDWSFNVMHVDAGEINNGYDYAACTVCGTEDTSMPRVYDKTDWSTYDSQKRVLDDLLADRTKFTDASFAEFQNDYTKATSGVTSGDETKSQTFIDNKVKALIAAKDLLKSTVTLNIYDFSSGNPELLGNSVAKDVKYLSTETLSIPEEYQNEYTVYQWKINNKGVDKVIGSNSYSINAIVNDNVTYNVYLKKNAIDEAEAATKAVVTLVNKSNNAIDIAYITKSDTAQTTTVDCGNRTITIGGVALTAPKYAFYDLIGFNVNGTKVYDTAEIVINDNITIRPIYSASSTLQIDCASAVSINGNAVQSYQAKWDEPIVIKADREVVWYTESNGNEIILGQGNTFRFRANENIVILTKDVPQTLEPCAKIGYFQYDVELNKVTVVNNFFVPEGKIVRAAGVILSTKTNDIEQMKKQSTGKFIVDPSKFTENGNQVRISVTRTANNAFNMHALAYVEFTDGTVCYSKEVVTCSYTPA